MHAPTQTQARLSSSLQIAVLSINSIDPPEHLTTGYSHSGISFKINRKVCKKIFWKSVTKLRFQFDSHRRPIKLQKVYSNLANRRRSKVNNFTERFDDLLCVNKRSAVKVNPRWLSRSVGWEPYKCS